MQEHVLFAHHLEDVRVRRQSGIARRLNALDVLLTDIVMPDGVTGRDLADVLKQEKPDLRVLFSSGYSSDIIGKDFVLSDGINFLQKPYNAPDLARAVRRCLDD